MTSFITDPRPSIIEKSFDKSFGEQSVQRYSVLKQGGGGRGRGGEGGRGGGGEGRGGRGRGGEGGGGEGRGGEGGGVGGMTNSEYIT